MKYNPMKYSSLALALALAGLGGAAGAQETVVKIGHSGPLSGAQAFSGKDNENGARLAVEELNAKPITVGGKKVKFELVSEDDQGDPKTSERWWGTGAMAAIIADRITRDALYESSRHVRRRSRAVCRASKTWQ